MVEETVQVSTVEYREEIVARQVDLVVSTLGTVEVPQIQRRPSQQPVETIVYEKAGGRRRLEKEEDT